MKKIIVSLSERSYSVFVGMDIIHRIHECLDFLSNRKWVIVTQPSVEELFGNRLRESLTACGDDGGTIVIQEGEKAKSLATAEFIYQRLLGLNCDRSAVLVALGGGVVGDVAGFVAATYMRGIDYIHVPTTLLAMVDSAIGGKTGVNLPLGKNLVGAFYQPKAVVADPGLLLFLPQREITSAMAEILKYGAIRDREFFRYLGQQMDSLLSLDDMKITADVISRCCEIKADIVSQDERERDVRRILNFGHTIGHALETVTGYDTLRHGEAVAYGMICAGYISRKLGFLGQQEQSDIELIIRKLPLPPLPDIDPKIVLETVRHDKKVKAYRPHFVLLKGLGNAIITDKVSEIQILRAVEAL